MGDLAIRVEHLSKLYTLGMRTHDSLRDVFDDFMFRSGQPDGGDQARQATLWALKDVSFEVRRGEFVSIIGANGSGKSTLLKILSRITEPTAGRAEIYGSMGSLLEVGTGFVPELTGRENIYLNGAILGMKSAEIAARFDEIVSFAEIERFIDTPVKRYSSGMYVRLAFAVAAHLQPEILMVDEVLSVGDAAFQKKCAGKMEDVAKQGRTILFVSHDMAAVAGLSTSTILLDHGAVAQYGSSMRVVQSYLELMQTATARVERILAPACDLPFTITALRTCDDKGNPSAVFRRSSPIVVTIEGIVHDSASTAGEYLVAIDIKNALDTLVFRTHNIENRGAARIPLTKGNFVLNCILPANLFPAGTYRIGLHTAITGTRILQDIYPVLQFDVVQDQLFCNVFTTIAGILTPPCEWQRMDRDP